MNSSDDDTMRTRSWLAVVLVVGFAAACGDRSNGGEPAAGLDADVAATVSPAPPTSVPARELRPPSAEPTRELRPPTEDERAWLGELAELEVPARTVEIRKSPNSALSPDGTRVAAPGDDAVCIIELASGDESCVSFGHEFDNGDRYTSIVHTPLVWSPDSRHVAVSNAFGSWGDDVWLLDTETMTPTPLTSDVERNGYDTPVGWTDDGSAVLVTRLPAGGPGPGAFALVTPSGEVFVLFEETTADTLWGIDFARFDPTVGLVISVPGELVTLLADEPKVLASADAEREAFPTAIQTTTDLSTVAVRNREREAVGGLPAAPDTVELIETQTGRVVDVPDAPVHVVFDPTNRWVATVYADESTDPVTWVVALAPIASPAERVEIFRSNADEYFLRTDRDARRGPASSPPAPLAVWSTDQHIVVPLTQSGAFLDLDMSGWSLG